MSDTSKREELIEEAAMAINSVRWNHALPHASQGGVNWTDADLARAALAVFEQAYTPRDDEVQVDIDMAVMLSQLVEDEPMWSCVVIAKKLHAAGFRRTMSPTNDEREALANRLDRKYEFFERMNSEGGEHETMVLLREASAALRRTVQGEPTDANLTRQFDAVRDSNRDWMRWTPFEIAWSFWRAALRVAAIREGESR